MKIIHGPHALMATDRPTLELDEPLVSRRPVDSRKMGLLFIAIAFLSLVGFLLVVAVHVATSDDAPAKRPQVYAALIADHRLDASAFETIPGGTDAATSDVIAKTSSDAETLQPLSQDSARLQNSHTPVTDDAGPAARPLRIAIGNGIEYSRALDCMTAAIYYEAANEPLDGQRAVAQVVINRTRHFAYPHSICAVVYQGHERATGCQFSFTCDGSTRHVPVPALWDRARNVANMALGGLVYAPVGLATHYHADYVVPYWASTLVKQAVIGRHIFYRWPGGWGTPRSFVTSYDKNEPDIWAGLQTAASLPVDGQPPLPSMQIAPSERPVLMAGAAAGNRQTAPPVPASTPSGENKDRVYLMSRAPQMHMDAVPARPSGGVTGGVIMPGTATLPVASSGRTSTIEQADRSTKSSKAQED